MKLAAKIVFACSTLIGSAAGVLAWLLVDAVVVFFDELETAQRCAEAEAATHVGALTPDDIARIQLELSCDEEP